MTFCYKLCPTLPILLSIFVTGLAGCTTTGSSLSNTPARPSVYVDTRTPGPVQGVGMESQDITSMTDRMMRDMLSNPVLAGGLSRSPHVIVDSEYFRNESTNRVNKNLITDRLRVELNRSAHGRMIFVARHYGSMVASERAMKRAGMVGAGTRMPTKAAAGGDYRLGGRMTSHDAIDSVSGLRSRFHQIVFEMVDLETGMIVWSGIYDFKKATSHDIVYR